MLGHKTKAEVITEANPIANARLGVFAFTQQPPPRRSPPESSALRPVLLRGVMPSSTRWMSKCKTAFLSIPVPDSGSGLFCCLARRKNKERIQGWHHLAIKRRAPELIRDGSYACL